MLKRQKNDWNCPLITTFNSYSGTAAYQIADISPSPKRRGSKQRQLELNLRVAADGPVTPDQFVSGELRLQGLYRQALQRNCDKLHTPSDSVQAEGYFRKFISWEDYQTCWRVSHNASILNSSTNSHIRSVFRDFPSKAALWEWCKYHYCEQGLNDMASIFPSHYTKDSFSVQALLGIIGFKPWVGKVFIK